MQFTQAHLLSLSRSLWMASLPSSMPTTPHSFSSQEPFAAALVQLTLLRRGGWTRWPTEVPSNPYYSVILWFCAERSEQGVSRVCSWDSLCLKPDVYSWARKPSSAVIPTAPAMRWSPQIVCIKYSLRDSKASFHWVCFKFLSNILYFFAGYMLYFYWLFRKERNKTSSRPLLHSSTYIFF